MKIEDLDININDNSAGEFADELLEQLRTYRDNFSTHAMSQHQLTLVGQKQMLIDIINYIQKVSPHKQARE